MILHNVLCRKCINLLSHQQCRRVRFSPPLLQCLSICRLLNTSHSDWCDVIPQCGFDLHSLLLVMLSIFSCGLLAVCMSSLGKCLSRSPAGRYPRSWRRQWQATPVFLPGEFPGQRSLVGHSPWGCKESHTTERLETCHIM